MALQEHGKVLNFKRTAEQIAHKLGVSKDIYIEGSEKIAIVDKKLQKVFFVTSPTTHFSYSFSDIIEMHREWGSGSHSSYIVFTIRDEENPIFRVGNLNNDEAEKILAKLSIVINEA